jgi:uncharacterized membrane protein YoaK (UPF0700 family)
MKRHLTKPIPIPTWMVYILLLTVIASFIENIAEANWTLVATMIIAVACGALLSALTNRSRSTP